jgi:hypothetical protein
MDDFNWEEKGLPRIWAGEVVDEGAVICGGGVAVLQADYARCARLDARPHEKTFQAWAK